MKTDEQAKESQNQQQIDDYYRLGPVTLGPWTSHIWRHDLRHIGFLLARYKFCAKMLAGKVKVLEVGCGDASGSPVVAQTVGHLWCVDFEPLVVKEAIANFSHISKIEGGGGSKLPSSRYDFRLNR